MNTSLETTQNFTASLPPEDVAAEEAIIGCIFLDKESMSRIEDSLEPRDFYTNGCQKIYETMLELQRTGTSPDLITVASRLKGKGQLDDIGGQARLEELRSRVISSANIEAYAQMVHEKAKRRALLSYSSKLAHLAHETEKPLSDVVNEAEGGLFEITQNVGEKKAKTSKEIMLTVKEKFLDVLENGLPPGLTTGFTDFDALTDGLQPKEFWVFAGRPGSGKTAFSVNVAQAIAERHTKPVLFFSLEMGDEQLIHRVWSGMAEVESSRIRTGRVSSEQINSLLSTEERVNNLPLLIDEEGELPLTKIRSRSRQAMREHGQLGAIVVDYIQLVGGAGRDSNRTKDMGEVARGLKKLAKELNVTVIGLCQINRGTEGRTNKRPMMSDMRDSGEIEEAADLIAGLYREEYYDEQTDDKGIAEIIILKHRNGPTGTVKLLFQPEYTKFLNRGCDEATYNPPKPKTSMRPAVNQSTEEEWGDV